MLITYFTITENSLKMSSYQLIRSSIVSQTSRSYSMYGYGSDNLTDAELVKYVNELKEEIRLLKLENEILENTIKRLEPALMQGVYQALEYATKLERSSSSNTGSYTKSQASKLHVAESLLYPSRLLSSPSRLSTRKGESLGKIGGNVIYGSGPKINVLEMIEIISTETGVQEANLRKFKNKAARQKSFLKAQLEEIDIRVCDTEKASNMFKQDVLIDGWDKIAQRIPAETWIRFMTEWVKIADSQVAKLRLRTSTLNAQYRKFKSQIKVKSELSESLRPVDFEKMTIENSECEKLIEHKIRRIKDLKKLTGDANLTLSIHKRAMMSQNNYLNKVLKTKMNKITQTEQIDKEHNKIQIETENLSQKLDKIKNIRINYEGPDIMDYVTIKWNITELKRAIKMLENRAHIHQISLSSVNKHLHKMENEIE